jgi:hypothetical protein
MRRSIDLKHCCRNADARRGASLALLALTLQLVPAAAPAAGSLRDINLGDLVFLKEAPKRPPYVQEVQVIINEDSLKTGWVQTSQCHYRLDRAPALEVVFSPERARKLRILRTSNIGRAWVEGSSVQVEEIGAEAVLCIFSENRTLQRSGPGGYEWRGGPYMRRFFDGYFPVHLKLHVLYPNSQIQLNSLEPSALQLKSVQQPGQVDVDALFEGRLQILMHFVPAAATDSLGW